MPKISFPAGTYYIGDPSYCLSSDNWQELIYHDGSVEKGIADSTAYGDGSYFDGKGNEYFVDAGCIGVIPITQIKKKWNKGVMVIGKGYNIVTFDKPFEAEVENGILTAGDIVINTREDDEDEEDNYCEHCGHYH